MTRTTRLARLAGGLLAASVVLPGCSGGDDAAGGHGAGGHATSSTPAGESAAFNNADVTFVQGMIPHHRGALAMAQLAEGRAQDPRVLDLATRIEAAQQPEIDTMTGWLEEWGEPVPEEADGSAGGMDHGGGHPGGGADMGGMTEEGMAALETASGAEFDRMFLAMMIEHHRGAVEMAETEIVEGSNPDAVDLARDIADAQTAEITEMEALLAGLGG